MNFQRMTDLDLAGKRVLIREDLNVPVKNGKITSDARLRAALPSIKAALAQGAAAMVFSHLGRPVAGVPKPEQSLAPVAAYLSEALGQEVKLFTDYLASVEVAAGQVVLLENVRFNHGEKKNNAELAQKYAALCDVFVMDAFGTAHRAEASTEGVARYAKVAAAGPLLAAELDALGRAMQTPEKPMVAIVAGSKVSTKLDVLNSLSTLCDQLIVGGGIANTFLAAAGYKVAVADLDGQSAQETAAAIAEQFGADNVMAVQANSTDEADVERMVGAIEDRFGRIDVMVYNAGVAQAARIDSFPLDAWKRSIEVNLTGYFLCARAVSKIMMRQNFGRIIQINSKSGKVGSKHNSGYSAAKFGGVGLTQSLALDLADYNITVHSLMLGNLLKSPMFQSLLPQYAKKLGIPEDQVEQTYIDKVPLKRGCDYQDVLNVLKFYVSEEASYCTGQMINITGGQVMF